jgi:hypothetical protein
VSTFVQPTAGPHNPLTSTPDRRAPSARRTTSIDVLWPDFATGQVEVVVRGQDLVTRADGVTEAADELDVTLLAELASGRVVDVQGGDDLLRERVQDASLRSGFSRHLATVDPDGGRLRTLAYSALDDLPGAFLVAGYSMLREGLLDGDPEATKARAPRQGNICIGWRTDGPVFIALDEIGRNAVPYGPDAPPVEQAEPKGWHPLLPITKGTVRRRRQLDVWPAPDAGGSAGGGLVLQSHFRDSYQGDEPEMVMHEYLVQGSVGADSAIAELHVDPLVLPWEACPGSVGSAAVLVGVPLAEVEERARTETAGPIGCTHLTSTLRALADVQSLAARR